MQWLVGDLTGLAGALVQKLTPTISLLAFYYALCDILMLYLIYYYRAKRRNHPELYGKSAFSTIGSPIIRPHSTSSERTPLLSAISGDNARQEDGEIDNEQNNLIIKARNCMRRNWISILAYTLAAIFIISTGIIAWFSTGKHKNLPREDEAWSTSGQIVGWMSAFLYLGSRIPQIMKNTETKCQGLSLMMFCFR